MQEKINYYKNNQNSYLKTYWKDNDGTDLCRPNGLNQLSKSTYKVFAEQIDKDGKALDLGCGNGLMLKYLMLVSGYKLIPYGVDFMNLSIKQAKEILHPEYAANFTTINVIDYSFDKGPFDFIFVLLHYIHPEDRKGYLNKIKKNCRKNGKVIFYEYSDTLNTKKQSWIDKYSELKNWKLEQRDYSSISIGIWKNK